MRQLMVATRERCIECKKGIKNHLNLGEFFIPLIFLYTIKVSINLRLLSLALFIYSIIAKLNNP